MIENLKFVNFGPFLTFFTPQNIPDLADSCYSNELILVYFELSNNFWGHINQRIGLGISNV